MEVDAHAVPARSGRGKVHRLHSRLCIIAATIVDQSPTAACRGIREVDRLLRGVGDEEIQVGRVVECEANQQATRKVGRRRFGERGVEASQADTLLRVEDRAARGTPSRSSVGRNRTRRRAAGADEQDQDQEGGASRGTRRLERSDAPDDMLAGTR